MISKRKVSKSSFVSFLVVAMVSAASAIWFLTGYRPDTETEFRINEARYQNQIQSLKLALKGNNEEFNRERRLAMRLQRELRDANRQIGDLSRKLAAAQRTISQRNQQLREASARQAAKQKHGTSQFAHVETTSALIVSRANSAIGLPEQTGGADQQVSRYSPSKVRRAKLRAKQRLRRQLRQRKDRTLQSARGSYTQKVRVSSIGTVEMRGLASQKKNWPLSSQGSSHTRDASVAVRNQRFDNNQVRPLTGLFQAPANPVVRRARKVRRVAAVNRRPVRRARFTRYSRLGARVEKRRPRRVTRYRKSRKGVYRRSGGGGVFGSVYGR